MRNDSKRDWWRLRRVLWPLGSLAVLGIAGGLGILYSGASRVVVYNETGAPLSRVTVTACGTSQTFRDVQDRESVGLVLRRGVGASDVAVATNGVEMWRGDYIEPRGGYRVVVRLRADGQVECTSTISGWQSLLRALSLTPSPNS